MLFCNHNLDLTIVTWHNTLATLSAVKPMSNGSLIIMASHILVRDFLPCNFGPADVFLAQMNFDSGH